ncbi:MAG: hypothetical protein EHM14_01285 [Methanothrix sp.]|nr:MAG: hypothetical protein EHM14_01285 [Methanothrix sp.]
MIHRSCSGRLPASARPRAREGTCERAGGPGVAPRSTGGAEWMRGETDGCTGNNHVVFGISYANEND